MMVKNPAFKTKLAGKLFFALTGALLFSPAGPARTQQSVSSAPALTEKQRTGRILFMQNCAFCHLPYRTEDKTGKETASIAPSLKGLLQKDKPLPDAAIRTFIAKGVPRKMPAFQYGLDPKEVDLIIEYLKVY